MGKQHDCAAYLLKKLRQSKLIDYLDESRHDLADRLCEVVLSPWLWTTDDLKRKSQEAYRHNKPYYDSKNMTEQDSLEDIEKYVLTEIGTPKIGIFYPLKAYTSITQDFLDFLIETDRIEEVFGSDTVLTGTLTTILTNFTGKEVTGEDG